MTNRQLKKKIREAFAHGTPDISQEIMVDTLFSDPQDRKEVAASVEEQRKPIRFPIFSAAAAACAAIAVLAISINLIANRPNSGSAALITAEEALNAVAAYPFGKPTTTVAPVVDWELNTDTDTPQYDISLSYDGLTVYKFVVDAQTGNVLSMEPVEKVTVDVMTPEAAKQIALSAAQADEAQITNYRCETNLDDGFLHYSIFFRLGNGFYHYKVSFTGEIIDQYVLQYTDTDEEQLPVVTYPIPAVSAALSHAGFTQENVSNLEVEEDLDDEIPHIDVSFIADGTKYEYEVKPDGTVLEVETEPMEDDFISSGEAMAKFWEYLNVTPAPLSNNLSWTLINYQDRMCYDIIGENTDGTGVRMKIDATTGALLLKESADGLQPIPTPNVPDGKLSTDQATSIALKQVGLSSKRLVTDFELEEDSDDDHPHYDVSFVYQGVEYSFEIGMYDGGQILEAEQEPVA